MINFRDITDQLLAIKNAIFKLPKFEWATVSNTDPISIHTDIDPNEISGVSKFGSFRKNDRVRIERQGTQLTVWGVPVNATRISQGTAAERASVVPEFGDIWRDTDGDKSIWKGSSDGRWRLLSAVVDLPKRGWDFTGTGVYTRTDSATIENMWLESSEAIITDVIVGGNGWNFSSLTGFSNSASGTSLNVLWRKAQFSNNAEQRSKYIVTIVDR